MCVFWLQMHPILSVYQLNETDGQSREGTLIPLSIFDP